MNTLAAEQLARDQAALLHALTAWPCEPDAVAAAGLHVRQHALTARGLNAYRANAHAGAGRALRAAYPVLALMLGDESFDSLACALWHRHLPRCGDWGQWGRELPGFVQAAGQLANVPYLADVARVEWAMHAIATAPDPAPDCAVQAHTFELLTRHDPAELGLQLAPYSPPWQSLWPVVSLVHAHMPGNGQSGGVDAAWLAQASALLEQNAAESVMVWRKGWRPCVREALAGEAAFLKALASGQNLHDALNHGSDLDFADWLQTAIQTRLLIAVIPI